MDAILRTILSSSWAIDEAYAISVNEIIQPIFSGKTVAFDTLVSPKSQPDIITNRMTGANIARVKMHDVMIREDYCGVMGTESLNNLLISYASDSAIGGVILDFDTPGGQTAFTENVAETIANFPKPIVAFVSSCCASAGYWLASQCDAIFTSVKTDRVGSVGTMISYRKVNPESVEKPEYILVNVYSSQSPDKNRASDEMIEGKHDRMINKVLNPLTEVFIESIKNGRSNVKSEALTGEMYYSAEAIKLGLIDGIKSFDEVIDYISEEIKNSQNQNTMGLFSKHKKPQPMKNELFSSILERDVNDGEILSVEDLQKVQSHIEGLNHLASAKDVEEPINAAAKEEEAPTQSIADVVANAVSQAITPLNQRFEAIETALEIKPAAGATTTAPVSADAEDFAEKPWEDPNRSYNKIAQNH
jgi:ClpP class serine protease